MANKTFQLLRNNNVITEKGAYADVHAAALAALNTQLAAATTLDGQPVLVRYNDGSKERTILGIKGKTGTEIFDNVAANDAIKALDKADAAVSGQFVTAVSETDGVITVSRDNLTDAVLAGYAADTTKTGAIAATDTLEQALNKLENKTAAITVASADGTIDVTSPTGGGTDLAVNIDGTTIVKANDGTLSSGLTLTELTAAEITALGDANVKEAYKVIYATDTNRNAIGNIVKIYKDQTLKSASFANQILTLTYILADGSESVVDIDMSALIEEQEVENGIQVIDHKLSIKLDTTGDDTGSGKFLTVGANGLKLDGVTDAIAAAVNDLDATVSQTAGTDGLALSVTEVDGVITAISGSIAANTYDAYGAAADVLGTDQDAATANTVYGAKAYADAKKADVIGESTDAATDNTIYGAKAYANAAIAALNASDTAADNQFVTSVSESAGVISVTRAQPAAAGVTVADSGDYFAATNVESALAELAAFDCGTY